MRHNLNHIFIRGPRALSSLSRAFFEKKRSEGHVLMMHNGRSGSTLLGDILDQHRQIFWDGETIEKMLHREAKAKSIGIDKIFNFYNGESAIQEIKNRIKRRAGNRVFGTEIQDYHLKMIGMTLEEFIQELKILGFTKFIFLDRNYMRKVVSHIVATERKKFHVSSNSRTRNISVRINPDKIYIGHQFKSLLSALESYQSFFTEASKVLENEDSLFLTYENDIQNTPAPAVEKSCSLLDLPVHNYKVNFSKTTNIPLHQVIENYDEVSDLVSNSAFASHMEDTII